MNFRELNLEQYFPKYNTIKIKGDVELQVKEYLPIDAKADLVTWIVDHALDDKSGCISPVRFEVYFCIGIVQRYCDLEIDVDEDIGEVYDTLEVNDVINQIFGAIPEKELNFITELAKDSAADIVRFNNSFAGMVSLISSDANNIDQQLQDIMSQIKNREGLEQLDVIKDVVGTD